MYTTQKWEKNSVPLPLLSKLFVEFYKGAPWNEMWICPSCKPENDFGPEDTYGQVPFTTCPKCGSPLELFWSEKRLKHYLFTLNPHGEIIFIDGKLAGWWRGRFYSKDVFYVDVMAILPEFRNNHFRKEAVDAFKSSIEKYHQKYNLRRLLSRTHKCARHVSLFFRSFGFLPLEQCSEEDPERIYWVLDY